MPQAHMADGAVLDFPEGTSPEVIDRVAKEYVRKGAGRPVETAVGGGGRPVETSRAPTLDLAPVPRAVPIPVSAPLSAGLTTVPAGPTGTMPSGAPQPGEGIYRFMEAPLGAPEEPETRGAVLRNIPRTLAGLPLAIGSLPVTAPARAWGEGPAEAAKQIATTLPIPGVAETVAAMEARPGERVEAAIRQFGRSGGLDLPLAVLAAHGMGRGITEGAARYVGEPLAEAGARGVEGLAREREVVGQYPMPAGPRVATPVEAGRLLMAPSRRGPAVETPYEALRRLRTGIPPSEEGRTYGAMPVPPAGAPPLPPEPPPSPAVPPRPATTEAAPAPEAPPTPSMSVWDAERTNPRAAVAMANVRAEVLDFAGRAAADPLKPQKPGAWTVGRWFGHLEKSGGLTLEQSAEFYRDLTNGYEWGPVAPSPIQVALADRAGIDLGQHDRIAPRAAPWLAAPAPAPPEPPRVAPGGTSRAVTVRGKAAAVARYWREKQSTYVNTPSGLEGTESRIGGTYKEINERQAARKARDAEAVVALVDRGQEPDEATVASVEAAHKRLPKERRVPRVAPAATSAVEAPSAATVPQAAPGVPSPAAPAVAIPPVVSEAPGTVSVPAEGGAATRGVAAKGEKGFIEAPSANDAARFAKTMILKGPLNATNDLLERHLFGPAFEAVRSRIPEAIRTPIAKRLLDARAGQPAFMRGLVQARDAAMSTDYQRVEDLYNGLSKTPKADQPLLWKAINGLDSIEPGTPEWGVLAKNREAVDAAQAFHHEMGGAAVEYGLMSKPSFDAYDGHYQHLVAASAAPFRSRGSGGVPGLQPALRSDYGVFQHRTGEGTYIEDARVSLTEGAPQMIHAVRTAELLREVQDKPDLYRPLGEVHLRAMRAEIETARASGADPAMVQKGEANLAEFAAERDRLIAAGWRELPESPRLRSTYMNAPKAFDLSGGLAAPGAFEDVSTLARMMDDAEIAKAALLSAWKGGMVANFVTEMGNLMSAARNADVKAGIPLSRQVSLLPMAVREMVARGPLFREALKAGVFRGAFTKADIDAMGEAIDATLAERHRAGGELAWYVRYALNLRKAMARFPVSRLYQANDNAFKMMIYMTERELGRSPEEAAKLAQETEHDYGTVGTWTQAARSHWWALPFVSYTAKQLPFELKAMATRPLATLKWWFIVDALKNAVARARGETDAEQRKRERIVEHRAPGRLALPSTQGALEAAVGGDRRVPYTDLTQVMGFAPRVGRFTFGEAPFVPTGVAFNPRLPWQLSQPAYRAREGAMPGPFAPMMTPAAVLAVEAATKLDPRTGQRIAPAGSTAAQETGAFGTEAATSLLPSLLVRQPVEAARILSGKKSRDIYGHREDRARQLWNTFMAPKAYKTNASDIARGMRKGLKIEMKEARRPSGELRMMSPAKRHDERQAERERKRALKLELRSVLHGP